VIGDKGSRVLLYSLRLSLLTAVLIMAGCGYSIHPQSSLPAGKVRVEPVVNKTREPKLEDKLHRALTEEFVKQGVKLDASADYTLFVSINGFTVISMAEREGVTVDYRIVANVNFRVLDRSGKVIQAGDVDSPFIVSVPAAENLGTLLASKEAAEEEAMRDIAMEVVGAFIYR
jgi:outer membrane lipopolysaccharide assembly protein LptE/RlpB